MIGNQKGGLGSRLADELRERTGAKVVLVLVVPQEGKIEVGANMPGTPEAFRGMATLLLDLAKKMTADAAELAGKGAS